MPGKICRSTTMLFATLGLWASGAFAQSHGSGQHAAQPGRAPTSSHRPIINSPRQPAHAQPAQPHARPQVQPQSIQPTAAPSLQPGAVPTGMGPPTIAPMNIQGQRAPTPFWWGPTAGGARPGRSSGPIPGAYTPMGRPAVNLQPPAYLAPGAPARTQNELSFGPLPPPGPNLPLNGASPFHPFTDPLHSAGPQSHGGAGRQARQSSRDVLVHGGSGTLIRGHVEGDNFQLGFTAGGVPFHVDRFGFAHDIGHSYRFNRHHDFFRGAYPVFYGYDNYYYAPVYGQAVTIDPAYVDPYGLPVQAPPMVQFDESILPTVERGHLALEEGRVSDAIQYYKAHLAQNESDADAMRWLAVALMADGQPAPGTAMLIMAYQTNPDLAVSPLIASRFPDGDAGLRARFGAAVNYAHSTKGSSAFLAAAVLAQAQGKLDVARRMLDRAKAAGLDRQVVFAFESALRK